ncbi:MAG: LLM class flavin-dependent oxidoreductase [Acidimicrobiia bacterium]
MAIDFAGGGEEPAARLQRLKPVVRAAGELGYTGIWAGESYAAASNWSLAFHTPNALMTLVRVADWASTPVVGTATLLAPAWDLFRLAHDTALADQLVGGRLVVGMALGPKRLWETRQVESADIGAAFEKTVTTLRDLWSGESVAFTGDDYVNGAVPLPAQPGGPPVWIGGGGSLAARRAAHLAEAYVASTGYPLQRVCRLAGEYWTFREGSGHVAANRMTVIARSTSDAQARSQDGAVAVLHGYAEHGLWESDRHGRTTDEMIDDVALIGTPDHVLERVQHYADVGVTGLQLRVAPGATTVTTAIETLERFQDEVLRYVVPNTRVLRA